MMTMTFQHRIEVGVWVESLVGGRRVQRMFQRPAKLSLEKTSLRVPCRVVVLIFSQCKAKLFYRSRSLGARINALDACFPCIPKAFLFPF